MKKILTTKEVDQLKEVSDRMQANRKIISDCYGTIEELRNEALDITFAHECVNEEGFIAGWFPKYIETRFAPVQYVHDKHPDIYMLMRENGLIQDHHKSVAFKVVKA